MYIKKVIGLACSLGVFGGMVEDTECATNANVKTKADTEAIFSTSLYNEGFSREYGWFGVQQDAKTAVELYKQAADQGNDDAQYRLGLCYANGTGIEQDRQKAVEWYRKAADQGNADAQYKLGMCYLFGLGIKRDPEKAVELYHQAANANHAVAQHALGECYDCGHGVAQDKEKALEWFKKAANNGDLFAKKQLQELEQTSKTSDSR